MSDTDQATSRLVKQDDGENDYIELVHENAVIASVWKMHTDDADGWAERMVRAVNGHDALVEALDTTLQWIENWSVSFEDDPEWREDAAKARAALAAAKGDG